MPASAEVRTMFASVARSYDRANQVLSLGMHHGWRRAAVRWSGAKPGDRVLDCATGTGDLALAFKRSVGARGEVVATDFCEEMLALGPAKAARAGLPVRFEQADLLSLPYADASFDVVSVAFGIRNVEDPARGIREMARVARPGGRVIVLEFGQPGGSLFGPFFRWYSRAVLPRVGGWISGRRSAYEYLDRTAARFPAGAAFAELMRGTGRFREVLARPLTGGVAYVYAGEVAGAAAPAGETGRR
ncbi:MAG TPA: bifunctional demethylmenaquinone methyltransferase/2-methoxy-6-polyprenyl-1,4-benzoquinol methylase UbiE [Candidatus Limnocylindrales bacterium]|nr:bifunctional demethylmenaquinone methyltransferase/2-methoxy-6-polyprenyl-1,4-benzoquinol methylase UbiE [Candidatus Limnocylindrales bacterium]